MTDAQMILPTLSTQSECSGAHWTRTAICAVSGGLGAHEGDGPLKGFVNGEKGVARRDSGKEQRITLFGIFELHIFELEIDLH